MKKKIVAVLFIISMLLNACINKEESVNKSYNPVYKGNITLIKVFDDRTGFAFEIDEEEDIQYLYEKIFLLKNEIEATEDRGGCGSRFTLTFYDDTREEDLRFTIINHAKDIAEIRINNDYYEIDAEIKPFRAIESYICDKAFLEAWQHIYGLEREIEASKKSEGIKIKTDVTVARNLIEPYTGLNEYVAVTMVEGEYVEDWNPGAYMGRSLEGNFELQLVKSDSVKASYQLSRCLNPIIFNDTFDIQFDDYNDDGNIDFTIGQFKSSNGNIYVLFSIIDHQIVRLNINNGSNKLFISSGEGYYSTLLEKVNNTTFKTVYYDNSECEWYETYYEWQDKQFELIKKEVIQLNE